MLAQMFSQVIVLAHQSRVCVQANRTPLSALHPAGSPTVQAKLDAMERTPGIGASTDKAAIFVWLFCAHS